MNEKELRKTRKVGIGEGSTPVADNPTVPDSQSSAFTRSLTQQQMLLLGANSNQIRLVSYGEERPASDGHDDASWQQNRRVEILY